MNKTELAFLSIDELSHLTESRQISPVEIVETSLERFARLDGMLNSAITVMADEARQAARDAEREIAAGRWRGRLHGIPIGLKDLIWTRGVRTTCASKIMADFVPDTDATCVTRLRAAGAIPIAKLNLHEWAYGATSTSSHFGRVCNPWNPAYIAGGSSGGSAAAVAAGLCYAALGTDTGGSIRVPASLCGVVGLKPTYGRISRRGVAPLSWSLDHVGPMTRTVKDAAILLNVLAGPDPADPTCAQTPVPDYTAGIDEGVKDLRIGISADLFTRMDGEVETVTRKAIAALEAMGAQTESVTIPLWDEALTAAIVLLNAEAVAVHETHLKNRPEDYGPDVRIRLEQGLFVTALEYVKAQRLRSLLAKDMTRLFEKIDVLVGPATPVAALSPDRETVTLCGHTEDPRAALTRTTRFHNLLGLPSISVPCGVTVNGLPIGLQIAAASFYEATVLRVAHVCEQTSGWVSKHPSVG